MNTMHRSTDHETGEVTLTKRNVQMIEIDMETGEMDSNISTAIPMTRRTTFVVPKELYQTRRRNKKKKLRCIDSVDNYTLFKKEEVINLHEVKFSEMRKKSIPAQATHIRALEIRKENLSKISEDFIPIRNGSIH